MKITIIDTAAYLDTPYNPEFVSQIKNIGGARWDSSRREWKIPAACVEQAREIMRRVFGECDLPDETRRVNVKLTFSESVCGNTRESLIIFGKQMPQKFVLLFRFFLIHTKAQVLYSKPHASMTRRASAICGNVAHMKHTDPPPQGF